MQIHLKSSEPTPPADTERRPEQARPDPAFDEALSRAQRREMGDEYQSNTDEDTTENDAYPFMMQGLAALARPGAAAQAPGLQAGAGSAQQARVAEQAALSQVHQVQSVAATPSVPVQPMRLDLAGPQAMVLQLQQAGAGHAWQMRLKADSQTRELVTPHLQSLRDRLHGRNVHLEGFSDEEEI